MNRPITLQEVKDGRGISFRFGTADDLPKLLPLYERFYEEAIYKDLLDYDPEKVEFTLRSLFWTDSRPHILVHVDEELAGFIAYAIDNSFSKKPCQVMQEFYVLPEYRRGALGRMLLSLAIFEGKQAGAGAFHAPVASGTKEAPSLFNLFRKAGFHPMGFIMRRKIGG